MRQQRLAGRGQLRRVLIAVKTASPELAFQAADLRADRRFCPPTRAPPPGRRVCCQSLT
jgi:hypothetical protein